MKRVWLNLLLLCLSVSVSAQQYARLNEYEESLYGKHLHVMGSYEAMQQVRSYWFNQFDRLKSYHLIEMTLCGNGESVLKVEMPSSLLFDPNEASLNIQSEGMLRPFLRLLRGKEAKATLLVACYSDNNGSELYLNEMTSERAQAICQWMTTQGVDKKAVKGYGVGNHVPLNGNANMQEREQNRRITLYLVPNKQMMKLARRNKLVH